MIIFNNPVIQTIAKAIVEKHGGTAKLLTVPSAGVALTGSTSPELIAMYEREIIACEAKVAALRDLLAVMQLAKSVGSEVIEVENA